MRIAMATFLAGAVCAITLSGCGSSTDASTGPSSAAETFGAPDASAASASMSSAEKEQRFMAAVGSGVPDVPREVALSMAQRTCSAFSEGATASDIRDILVRKGLTPAQASRVVLAAVSTYCQEFRDRAMG